MGAAKKNGAKGKGPTVVTEVERKFEVPAGFVLPDLTRLPKVAEVTGPATQDLDATYFDTPDLRLVANKLTLRRRTGGEDAGWHLKRPRTDGARDELRVPLGRATKTVPPALRNEVAVHVRGAELGPVVRLATTRLVHRLVDSSGAVLAEVAQDAVSASAPGRGGRATTVESWAELEVELVAGDAALLDAATAALERAGARVSALPSKLSRALGDRLPPKRPELPAGVVPGSAGAVLVAHLAEHVGRLVAHDPLVRADAPDAVHQMRVASRRLRSALATYRPLLDRTLTDPLRDELQWLGSALGGARDAEVTRDHLVGLVEAQPAELVRGPVVERIRTALGERYRAAHAEALTDLDSPRYFALLDALDRLVAHPPLAARAAKAPDKVLLPLVARTYTKLSALVDAARAETDPAQHDELLHEVRKAAKRARYAAESLAGVYGKPAKAWAGRMEAVQEALGEHQDSVVIRAELLTLTQAAADAGEETFTYGRLHGLEEGRAIDTEGTFATAWDAAADPALHAWLR